MSCLKPAALHSFVAALYESGHWNSCYKLAPPLSNDSNEKLKQTNKQSTWYFC